MHVCVIPRFRRRVNEIVALLYANGMRKVITDVADRVSFWLLQTGTCVDFYLSGYAYSAVRFRFRLRFRESEQEWGNHSGQPSDSDCLDRPADKGHSMRRLAPTLGIGVGNWICLHYALRRLVPILGIGVGNWICLHYALRRLAPILGIGVGTWICLHYRRTLTPYGLVGRYNRSEERTAFIFSLGYGSYRRQSFVLVVLISYRHEWSG